jgi:hypothetical protein
MFLRDTILLTVVCLLLIAAGCVGDDGSDTDASLDAGSDVGDIVDATDAADVEDATDAGDASEDTTEPTDTAADTETDVPWYIGEPCNADGRQGECLHTDDCGSGFESVPGLCPGPSPIQCCVEAPSSGTCDPNASYDEMPRPNEGLTETSLDPACPDGMIPVADFCVDAYEAALVEELDSGGERTWSPFFNPGHRTVRAVSIEGAVPQGYITGEQARAACQRAGKRLCTSDEWLRACRGSADNIFPYGDSRDPGVCNDARSEHPAVDYFDTNEDWIWSELGNACIGQQDDTVAHSGSHTGCVSEDGAYDMMGNVHEWVADSSGVFRGGFYADTRINGDGCLYATTAHSTQHWDYSTGFRCCAGQ